MSSITSWTRIEPRARAEELTHGLEARIHDPLWMLARQWQMGELKGEDSGSPVSVQIQSELGFVDKIHLGEDMQISNGHSYSSALSPIDPFIEAESYSNEITEDLWFAVQAGLQFVRLLKQFKAVSYVPAYISEYSLRSPTADDSRFLDVECLNHWNLMAGRVPDGLLLYESLRNAMRPEAGNPFLPTSPPIASGDRSQIFTVAQKWLEWCDSFRTEKIEKLSAWNSNRMEYKFDLSVPSLSGEFFLSSPEYDGGRLDWYNFDVKAINEEKILGESFVVETVATPVSYKGMPNPRWWEFEDSQIDFGAIEAGPDDLARLLVMEFALTYGNDWFLVPLKMPVGSLMQLKSFVVVDTFGERFSIPSIIETQGIKTNANQNWQMFVLSSSPNLKANAAIFLPPAASTRLCGPLIEEVSLVRDEISNLVWGIEHCVQNSLGRAAETNKIEQQNDSSNSEETEINTVYPQYLLMSDIPKMWIPFSKTRINGSSRFKRLSKAKQWSVGDRDTIDPISKVLAEPKELLIFEEEIPHGGITVSRGYQLSRWVDGSSHLWIGRKKYSGRIVPSNGLNFDFLDAFNQHSISIRD